MPNKTIEDFAYQIKDYMRSAEVVEGKNKLHPTNKSITPKGATITYNSDGTISKSGTVSDGDAQYAYAVPTNADYEYPADLENGEEYVLSGCPSGGSANTYEIYIQFRNADNTGWSDAYHDYGDGVSFTANDNRFSVYVRIFNGNTDTLTFSPMICKKSDWEKSHTYEPYYVPVKDSKLDIADQQVLGAWNFFDVNKVVADIGVTATKTTSGNGIKVSNATNAAYAAVRIPINIQKNKTYYFNTIIDWISGKGFIAIQYNDGSGWNTLADITPTEITSDETISASFNSGDHSAYRVSLFCTRATSETGEVSFDNISISLQDSDFSSYAMTNRELTDRVNSSSFGSAVQLTVNTDYVAPSDGVFTLDCYANGGISKGYINSLLVMQDKNTSDTKWCKSIYVKKGMTLKFTDGAGYFIPLTP